MWTAVEWVQLSTVVSQQAANHRLRSRSHHSITEYHLSTPRPIQFPLLRQHLMVNRRTYSANVVPYRRQRQLACYNKRSRRPGVTEVESPCSLLVVSGVIPFAARLRDFHSCLPLITLQYKLLTTSHYRTIVYRPVASFRGGAGGRGLQTPKDCEV